MRIAIPVWNEKVSPVFDTAAHVLVLQYKGSQEISRTETFLEGQDLYSRCHRLKALEVDILICGAISKCYYIMLCKSAGIRVIPWISGLLEEVLEAFLAGTLTDTKFLMPGCRWQENEEDNFSSAPACRRRKREKERIKQ
jgi:predicted Fe-Mo cluster-binding NifX family protein